MLQSWHICVFWSRAGTHSEESACSGLVPAAEFQVGYARPCVNGGSSFQSFQEHTHLKCVQQPSCCHFCSVGGQRTYNMSPGLRMLHVLETVTDRDCGLATLMQLASFHAVRMQSVQRTQTQPVNVDCSFLVMIKPPRYMASLASKSQGTSNVTSPTPATHSHAI